MGWNYRRRIKIAPGVHVNVGKNGVSTSFGGKGFSVTTGRNGTYMNTGIPGTGLYNRQKISGGTGSKSRSSYATSNPSPNNDSPGVVGCLAVILLILVVFIFSINTTAGFISLFFSIFIIVCVAGANNSNNKTSTQTAINDPNLKSELHDKASSYMTETYFNSVDNYVTSLIDFANELDKNKAFKESAQNLDGVSIQLTDGTFGNLDPSTFKGKLLLIMLVDLVRNLEFAGHKLDLNTKEGFGIFLFILRVYGTIEISYELLSVYYKPSLISSTEDLVRQMLAMPETEDKFLVSTLLRDFNNESTLKTGKITRSKQFEPF